MSFHNDLDNPRLPSRVQRKQARQKRSRWRRIVFLLTLVLTVFIGYEWASGWLGVPSLTSLTTGLNSKQPINILLVGSDSRGGDRGRSDTIVLATVNLREKQVSLLSIPRDTRTKVPGHGTTKINHAYAYGRIELLEKTVEDLMDVSINYYLQTDFDGFARIIDLLGGVTLEVEKRMYYPEEGINLKKGLQQLDGDAALGYVRYRSDGLGDIGRIERQQKFFVAAREQFLTYRTLVKAPQITSELMQCVNTNLPVAKLLQIANGLKSMEQEQFQTYLLPGRPQTINGLSYWVPKDKEMRSLIAQITK
ncbi:MAG: LCP family protein [Syntrophomonadaceae bacterium]|nr:LCP family protein [Syntrophomonadaceae bacterium]